MVDLGHAVGFGLVTAALLAIATVSVTMQFSVTNVPNFAQGDIITLGAYAAYTSSLVIQNIFVNLACAIVVSAAAAFLLNWGLIQPFLRSGAPVLMIFVLTIAVSLIIQNVLLAIFGGVEVEYRVVPPTPSQSIGPFVFTLQDEAIILLGIACLISVHVVLRYTKFGKSQRAVADDQELARVSGINSGRVINLTWLWAGAMTGLAGYVVAVQVTAFNPTIGFSYLLVVFAAAIVGGIGQTYGAMLGALLIGLTMEISALYVPADYKQAVAFVLMVVALIIRPDGLIRSPSRRAVQL